MSVHDITLTELKRSIQAQKTIYKFRTFLYSINKDIRHHYFDLCKTYLENEYNNTVDFSFDYSFNELGKW